jgi:hypothetical protein
MSERGRQKAPNQETEVVNGHRRHEATGRTEQDRGEAQTHHHGTGLGSGRPVAILAGGNGLAWVALGACHLEVN